MSAAERVVRYSLVQPVCDPCFASRWGAQEPRRAPVEAWQPETCVFCGGETGTGIYVAVGRERQAHPTLVDPR